MSKRIILTEECLKVIADRAVRPFVSNAVKDENGLWSVPLSDDVVERLDSLRLAGESYSDTIIRLCRCPTDLN